MEPHRKVRKQGLEHFIKFVRELPSPSPQAMFQAVIASPKVTVPAEPPKLAVSGVPLFHVK